MKLYMLSDKNDIFHINVHCNENVIFNKKNIQASKSIYAYKSIHHAILFNPLYTNFNDNNINIWECEGDEIENNGLIISCKKIKIFKKVKMPDISIRQRIIFAYSCAKDVLTIFEKKYPDDKRPQYALELIKKYLNGEKINKKKFKNAIVDATIFFIYELNNTCAAAFAAHSIAAAADAAANIDNIFTYNYAIINVAFSAFYAVESAKKSNTIDGKKMIEKNIRKMIYL